MTVPPAGRPVGPRDGAWRRARLADAYLYLCTGIRRARGDLDRLLEDTLAGGVDVVQLREKEAPRDEVVAAGEAFRAAAERHGALFVVNDDPALAVELGADGVHVGQDDASPATAREVVGPERIVGLSTHSPEQFDAGLDEPVDYLAVGPVEATPTKPGRPGIGLDPLRHAAAVTELPWFVTGGVSPRTVGRILEAGARRVVVVRALTDAVDPRAVASELAATLRPGRR